MAMNSTQLKGVVLDQDKDIIIEKYNKGVEIHILADKYEVGVDTIARRLRDWGIKVKKGDYYRKKIIKKHWYRKFSKEFLAHRAEITKMNGNKIKYIKDINLSHDQRMIKNVLKHSYIK